MCVSQKALGQRDGNDCFGAERTWKGKRMERVCPGEANIQREEESLAHYMYDDDGESSRGFGGGAYVTDPIPTRPSIWGRT